jgi:hypothetical protein
MTTTLNPQRNSLNRLIEQLVLLGKKYPKSTGGFLGLFTHHNQAMAKKLIELERFKNNTEALDKEFKTAITDIYNMFVYSRSLLPSIHCCILESTLFPEVTKKDSEIQANIDWINSNNDGGATRAWEVKDYQQTLVSLNAKETNYFEMQPVIIPPA